MVIDNKIFITVDIHFRRLNMKVIQFSAGSDPSVTEVLSPFSGQRARVYRASVRGMLGEMAHFPGGRAQLMKVPKLGYSLETVVFAVFGAASLVLVLMPFLGVS
jgi:hypothetical protein